MGKYAMSNDNYTLDDNSQLVINIVERLSLPSTITFNSNRLYTQVSQPCFLHNPGKLLLNEIGPHILGNRYIQITIKEHMSHWNSKIKLFITEYMNKINQHSWIYKHRVIIIIFFIIFICLLITIFILSKS
jgi:hypothetical protein